ncbi:heat shock protein DnaJ domain protein [Denitrovibrio acetiphilus DSM 12809]|uniref:Heat shock protein DnaJ domain protein n=1 Tax=Denitrovibrio acetiphilus (strain DSM 12809 / NBRC 114555 / N2460) TaxID=522772 RepID=D4H6N8_DENA2|nr:DNA-J related domain-containing protein [Denitrovibrio acetiphilus]ADD67754.1 heat shock protein DnaJ domain protein [Denitrovibrio acetiphilus DSM 12809]
MTLENLLTQLDTDALKDLIETETVYESKMLKTSFSDISITGMPAVELYRLHFALFHKLYKLQNEYAEIGKYLHVHFMRTGVFDYPGKGQCAYFHDETMSFCGEAVADGSEHCALHNELLGDTAVESISLKYFYLDGKNYDRLNSVTAESLLSGAWEILSSENNLDDSYRTLGLYGHENSRTVKTRFHELCKKHHPDQGGNVEKFMNINRAYRFVIKWLEDSAQLSDN